MRKFWMPLLLAIMTLTAACSEPIAVGAKAPEVSAKDQDGNTVKLADAQATGAVLVFFYPRANTPGCTAQACSLRDSYEALTAKGVRVIGVSTDSVERQKAFQKEHKLPFTLLADTDGKVCEAFGVPRRASFAARQAFLIKDGKIVWRDLSASTDEQAKDVLKALEAL
jgi:peroxiredoxin Q/BCP